MNSADLLRPFLALGDHFVPAEYRDDPELFRKSRLIVNFGIQGGIFGLIYAVFYFTISHPWGGLIVLACTAGLLMIGLSRMRNLLLAGNLQALIMTLGFAGLSAIEGGIMGHAVGWLATVPVSALILADRRSGVIWLLLSLAGTIVFASLFACNFQVPILYPPKWHSLVTGLGYVGLTLFTGCLGFIFENGRHHAHRRMEHALRNREATNQVLARLNQEKSDMMQVVAHDLKSPLQAIQGHAGLITDGIITDEAGILASASQVVKTSQRMAHLIDEMLDLNAIEEGRFAIKSEDVDFRELVNEAVSHHHHAAETKKITLTFAPLPDAGSVRVGRGPATQVLDNLISNSVKYSPHGTEVTVSLLLTAERGIVEVRDQGPGISAEDQTKLFQKFTKLTARPTGGESSSGLGLSIAKKIVEAMGGTIGCRSELGHGSTFFIEFPRTNPSPT